MDGDQTRAERDRTDDDRAGEAARLDGNVAAGMLSEIFVTRFHDGARDACELRGREAVGSVARVRAQDGNGDAVYHVRFSGDANGADTHPTMVRPDRCETSYHGGTADCSRLTHERGGQAAARMCHLSHVRHADGSRPERSASDLGIIRSHRP
jgi:hypothetical protein